MSYLGRISTSVNAATQAFETFAGAFPSKASQRQAINHVNRAYESFTSLFHDEVIASAPYGGDLGDLTSEQWIERGAYFRQRDIPFSLHHVRDRHFDIIEANLPGGSVLVRDLIALRNAITAAEIIPAEPKTDPKVAAIRAKIEDIIALRREQYGHALELGEIFGDLPVYTNWHWVQNQYGTIFPRCFFYLNGKLTPLSIIIAAAEELERRKDAGEAQVTAG